MTYCSLSQLKTYVGATDTGDDALLTECITRAQTMIDRATRRTFEAATATTRTFDAVCDVDGRRLFLDADLCTLTSITNGDGGAIDTADVVTTPRNATPWFELTLKASSGEAWTYTTDPESAIAVTGKWAYSATPPADIEQACVRLAAWLYRQKDSSADLDRPLVSADGATLLPTQVPNDVLAMLAPYKRVALR